MFRHFLLFALAFACIQSATFAQWGRDTKQFHVLATAGTAPIGEADLNPVEIEDKLTSAAIKLRWNVHKVYPYAKKVAQMQAQIAQEMQQLTGAQRRAYIKTHEEALFAQYEPIIRKMTPEQGRILLKLINREAHITMYDLVKDDKNTLVAMFWQGTGRIFGVNLKAQYNAQHEPCIEAIVQELEMGGYNMVYKTPNYALN